MVGFLSAKVWRVERAEGLGAVLAAVREPGWACRREHPCATQLGPLRLLPRKSLLAQLFPGTSFPYLLLPREAFSVTSVVSDSV